MRTVQDLSALLGAGSGGILGAAVAPALGISPAIGALAGVPLGGIGGSKLGKWFANNYKQPVKHIKVYGDTPYGYYESPQPIVQRNIFEDLNSDDVEYQFVPIDALHSR